MDYVKRRLEQLRRQGLDEKLEEAMRQHGQSRESAPSEDHSGSRLEVLLSSLRRSHSVALVLIGIVAGAAITTLMLGVKSGGAEIMRPSQSIGILTKRVQLLADNVSALENKLTHVLAIADAIENYPDKQATDERQHTLESPDTRPATETVDSASRPVAPEKAASKAVFTPTHSVASRLNLRAAASREARRLGILSTGARVQKIDEDRDWYYVDTEEYGKGWCFSEYLHPLP